MGEGRKERWSGVAHPHPPPVGGPGGSSVHQSDAREGDHTHGPRMVGGKPKSGSKVPSPQRIRAIPSCSLVSIPRSYGMDRDRTPPHPIPRTPSFSGRTPSSAIDVGDVVPSVHPHPPPPPVDLRIRIHPTTHLPYPYVPSRTPDGPSVHVRWRTRTPSGREASVPRGSGPPFPSNLPSGGSECPSLRCGGPRPRALRRRPSRAFVARRSVASPLGPSTCRTKGTREFPTFPSRNWKRVPRRFARRKVDGEG